MSASSKVMVIVDPSAEVVALLKDGAVVSFGTLFSTGKSVNFGTTRLAVSSNPSVNARRKLPL